MTNPDPDLSWQVAGSSSWHVALPGGNPGIFRETTLKSQGSSVELARGRSCQVARSSSAGVEPAREMCSYFWHSRVNLIFESESVGATYRTRDTGVPNGDYSIAAPVPHSVPLLLPLRDAALRGLIPIMVFAPPTTVASVGRWRTPTGSAYSSSSTQEA